MNYEIFKITKIFFYTQPIFIKKCENFEKK